MSRRLLTYICIDTSGSMKGEPIEAVNVGLQSLLSALRQNPYALDSVYLSIFTFDSEIKNVLPLTALEDVTLPTVSTPDSGPTFLGKMLEELASTVQKERILGSSNQKGDWRPILILLTDGKPSDVMAYNNAVPLIKSLNFGNIVACAAGPKADPNVLKKLTDTVVSLDTMDSNSFAQFFQWVSASVAQTSVSVGAPTSNSLPPPPDEINIVL
ncbi:vWA domain-containing protein [Glaesserella parasuis]|uniref:vWA domain-containing protein n=1 Tax=Glaesserella parasuis TaxID=738 RepID=UPI0009B8BEED|nr:VWA domain-containing protein [Glaesserella parasuis]